MTSQRTDRTEHPKENDSPSEGREPEGPNSPSLAADISPSITFATYQAAVPLVRSLRVTSTPDSPAFENLKVELSCEPAVVLPQTWHVSRLRAGDEISVRSRDVKLDGGMLDRLTERMRANVTIRLLDGDSVVAEQRHELFALARNEWGGASSMPELLASFVLPNDPAIATLLSEASDLLRSSGRRHSFEGYQSGTRERPWEVAASLWNAVTGWRLIYAEPPSSFERAGQKIRQPGMVADQRLATCLDTAVLFAAALEQAGLNPVICLVQGHALVGAWLRDATLPELITDDASLLRRYVELQDLILFETTFVTSSPPATFGEAIAAGVRHIREDAEDAFVYALDIRQARGREINPLPMLVAARTDDGDAPLHATSLALESPPSFRPLEDDAAPEAPSTPEGRIELWKRRLLDLTKRNRLLNLKPGKTAIRLVCPDVAMVEDRLAAHHKLALIPLERLSGEAGTRDDAAYTQLTRKDYSEEFARRALERDQLVADMPKPELQAGLVELYRKAASDLREGGANTLFLAIGTLRWRPIDKADGPLYRAPILLVPVTLERASAASTPKLHEHPDETVINLTLLEMLRHDFDIVIPELLGPLPTDATGVDVPEIMRVLRKAIGDARGWSVENEVVLSTFSFAKYLMWKDLGDRTADLRKSRFVDHMIEKPHQSYEHNAEVLPADQLDDRIDPKDLLAPLQADSSQVAAIFASGGEGDMVLEGPPGTGKSQTIANIIAHNLGLGRRVLFVAEKMTALSVVHDRLAHVGLGDFCLELHSNKASRRSLVDQLDMAWRNRESRTRAEWDAKAARLKATRDRLNALVRALHAPAPSGLSARQAIAEACASPFAEAVSLDWTPSLTSDRVSSPEELERLAEVATTLGEAFAGVSADERLVFADIGHADWSFEWSASLTDSAHTLLGALDAVDALGARLAGAMGVSVDTDSPVALFALAEAANALLSAPGAEAAEFLAPDGERKAGRADEGLELLQRYRAAHAKLRHRVNHEIVAEVDHDSLGTEWIRAQNSFVLFRYFKRRAVRKKAEAAWMVGGVDDVGFEARALAALKKQLASVRRVEVDLPVAAGWRGLDTSTDRMRSIVASARQLRAASARLGASGGDIAAIRAAIGEVLREGRERFADGMPDGDLARQFISAQKDLTVAATAFSRVAGLREFDARPLSALRATATAVAGRARRLNAWCAWQRRRAEAESAGLGAIVRALEIGIVHPRQTASAFRVSYCRWVAPLLIDSRPELREFSAVEHERLITQFRALDEELAKTACDEIRSRLSRDVPRRDQRGTHKGYSILLREVQAKRSRQTVRTILGDMGPAVSQLMPCALMSPMSVAQFIPPDAEPFDLVIFDEASQITTWDAIGAIARGRNVIIVGDPKQMPPTNFFNRSADDDEASEQESSEASVADMESILDEALATGMRLRRLTGHYRSKHESLIAYSNHAYYGGELVTYPAAETRQSAVSLVRVPGSYQKGKDRTNPIEAKAVVAEISRRLRDPLRRAQSIGVVTMNSEQQRLIRNLLDDERRAYPEIEVAFKGPDGEEEDMVYNLETVQGHERDVIMLSVGYGPSEPGGRAMSMNFGPLNRVGGERRLNVAITRATQEVVVFASFGPEMIDLSRTKARAVEDLKHYLDYAERGEVALRHATREGLGFDHFDSPFEEAVAAGLRGRGWDVRTQVGVSRFRIDLGVVDPDAPGRFLAGVECDGATYHGSAVARDRDRIRHNVLGQLGWTLHRLWSTDYFLDPDASLDRLHAQLVETLERSREQRSRTPVLVDERASNTAGSHSPPSDPHHSEQADATEGAADAPAAAQQDLAHQSTASPTDASADDVEDDGTSAPPAVDGDRRLYDDAYLPTLRQQCLHFIDRAGPMKMRYLADRIARAHGFARTGKTIRRRVWLAVGDSRVLTSEADRTHVVWPAGMEPVPVMRYRGTVVDGEQRTWDSTPRVEQLELAIRVVREYGSEGGASALASAIGFGRLTEARRRELDALISDARSML